MTSTLCCSNGSTACTSVNTTCAQPSAANAWGCRCGATATRICCVACTHKWVGGRTMPANPPLPAPNSMQRLVLSLTRDHSPLPASCKRVCRGAVYGICAGNTHLLQVLGQDDACVPNGGAEVLGVGVLRQSKGHAVGGDTLVVNQGVCGAPCLTQILLARPWWKSACSIAPNCPHCPCLACLPLCACESAGYCILATALIVSPFMLDIMHM